MTRPPAPPPAPPAQRLDKWLWCARFARTRSMAARLCEDRCVTLGGVTITKPHHPVRVGDALTILQGRLLHRVEVARLGERRGPPVEARQLYDEPTPPQSVPLMAPAWTPLLEGGPADGEPAPGG